MEGYDAKFEPPLNKRLECPICLLALREPMQTPCGHRFCCPCITRALGETGKRCPVDNTAVDHSQLFKDNFAKREVLCLNVLCPASEQGCSWHGELRDLQTHSQLCELITTDCPHKCGHSCQRKLMSMHLLSCPNKPQQCGLCSVAFVLNKLEEHRSHCSKLKVPKSILSDISEANEILKWTGHIKLKINKHQGTAPPPFTGYLTAKAETEQSFMYTGNWCSDLNVMSLSSGASRVFQDTLKNPEVISWQFFFNFLHKERSGVFINLLKGKSGEQGAAVGLHLKNNGSHQELTILYFNWSESKKRVLATVADLGSHIVRQIHTKLQSLQQNSRRGRNSGNHSRGHSTRSHAPLSGDHRQHHGFHHRGPPRRNPPHPHMHHQLHPTHAPPTTILPHLLSWQTSQSFNTYPWRVQNNVPFFTTFPSTPPQYLPANSYPYTFAPLPAAPFSISPMQPVVTHALPVPMTNEHVPVAVTLGNPNPSAVVSVNVIQQPVIHGPTQDSAPSQDLTILHSLGPTHQHFQTAHVAPMPLVQTDQGVIQNRPPVGLPNAAHVISLEQPSINLGMAMNQSARDGGAEPARIWVQPENVPGPSSRQQPIAVPEGTDSITSSPRLSPILYPDSDGLDNSPMDFRGISSQNNHSPSSSGDSPLQTLATAALSLSDSSASDGSSPEGNSSDGGALRLPVLINISDSELDSSVTTPASVIDLTSSPSAPHVMPSRSSQSAQPPVRDNVAPPMLVPVIHEREAQNSRRTLAFEQEEATRYVDPANHPPAPLNVPPGSILATAPQAMLTGGVLNRTHHPHSQPIVATMGQPNALPPAMAAIPTGNVQVLGWQPTFEAPPTQSHPPPPDVPMGGHLNILVPPSVVPGQAFPPTVIPHQPPRGEFWERVMPSLDMTLQSSGPDPRSSQQ